MDEKTFHGKISEHIKDVDSDEGKKLMKEFLGYCTYINGQYDEDKSFQNLNDELNKIEEKRGGEKNRLFYMALPPSVFTVVAKELKHNCYSEKGTNRIVIEKPFGKDLESSREMMGALKSLWKEEETFRTLRAVFSCICCHCVDVACLTFAFCRHRPLSRQGNGQEFVDRTFRQPGDRRRAEQQAR